MPIILSTLPPFLTIPRLAASSPRISIKMYQIQQFCVNRTNGGLSAESSYAISGASSGLQDMVARDRRTCRLCAKQLLPARLGFEKVCFVPCETRARAYMRQDRRVLNGRARDGSEFVEMQGAGLAFGMQTLGHP
ncbi:hypothetical protein CLAIMM_14724, partial [Cladophialophora immunda]